MIYLMKLIFINEETGNAGSDTFIITEEDKKSLQDRYNSNKVREHE